MSEESNKSTNLLDTTDCLEAVGVFRGWKNFLFLVILLCILLLQACFWIVDTGLAKDDSSAKGVLAKSSQEIPLTATKPAKIAEPNKPADVNLPAKAEVKVEPAAEKKFDISIKVKYVAAVVRFVNFLLLPVLVLYCLTMIFALKISLMGRLGGINHISRAFFISLILVVVTLPWQKLFPGVFTGMMFSSKELIRRCSAVDAGNFFKTTIYYLRFVGMGVLAMLLLIFAQARSVRWAKTILRRLEII